MYLEGSQRSWAHKIKETAKSLRGTASSVLALAMLSSFVLADFIHRKIKASQL